MTRTFLLAAALTCVPVGSQAADKAACAAKPFSLAKPAQPAAKPAPPPVKKTAPAKVAKAPEKPLAACKKKPAGG